MTTSMTRRLGALTALAALPFFAACAGDDTEPLGGTDASDVIGTPDITEADLRAHVVTLSSDEFGGRGPSSPGEELTVAYLAGQFQALGLQPGNNGSYTQDVPLVDITADPATATFTVSGGMGAPMPFAFADQVVTWTKRVVEDVSVEDSEMVFVGYGIVAPEYGWNDYEGIDVTGKTVVILVNDPGFATQDPAVFNGNAMTYYGRWTYKYEEAARQGAAAALVIHQTAPASYGWATVRNSWTGPQFSLQPEDGNMGRVAIEGWMSEETSAAVLGRAGHELSDLMAAALRSDFQAVELGLTFSGSLQNELRSSDSKNVIAVLPGSEAPDEYFLYMAHWDHLGTDPALEAAGEDGIFNGALDNATGTAALLELAQAWASAPQAPRRSIIFLAVTAEEQGLLGSRHYAQNPVFPLAQTVAGLNMDALGTFGPTNDMIVVGYGLSELDALMETAAGNAGRVIRPDPNAQAGYYYRSDHFELAKEGVPMIYPEGGEDHVEGGVEYGAAQRDDYTVNRYHQPTDEYDDSWDLSGAVTDVLLYYEVGAAVINSSSWPNWHPTAEFRAARDASRGGM